MGGTWVGETSTDSSSCTIIDYTLASRFHIPRKSTLIVTGTLTINSDVTILNHGLISVSSDGKVYNYGSIDNYGTIETHLAIYPLGTIFNQPGAIITNNLGATINNDGTLVSGRASIVNNGTINNSADGLIDVWLGTIINYADGIIDNSGEIWNEDGAVISNHGTINNNADSHIYNENIINNFSGATINNDGNLYIAGPPYDSGTVNNCGIFNNYSPGSVSNDGAFNNAGTINPRLPYGDWSGNWPIPSSTCPIS